MSDQSGAERMVGAVLSGRWKLLRVLGEGGMGAVFEAESVRGEGRVAIKVLHPEHQGNGLVLQRFYAEAQAAARIAHPNVARVFEHAQAEDGSAYLVMELLDGIPLAAYLRPGTPHAPEQAAPIVYAVLQALGAAHRLGIVHRDLKPENIFLVRDPSGVYQVKVLDFGIAKVMDAAGGMTSKTRTGMLLGTPGYMSPEQIKNAKGVDHRADLWSVGVIFYEMLAGQPAFPAPNELAKLTVVLTTDPLPIDRVRPELAAWRDLLVRATAREPDHRFQSADEMAQAIITVSRGGVVPLPTMRSGGSGPPASAVGPLPVPVTTHMSAQMPVRMGAPPAAARPSADYVPSIEIVRRGPPPVDSTLKAGEMPLLPTPRPPPPASRARMWLLVALGALCLAIGLAAGFLLGRG